MADKTNPKYEKYGEAAWPLENSGPDQHGEAAQRRANKAKHSERVLHGGNPGSGSKER